MKSIIAVLALLASATSATFCAVESERPNIVIFLADDFGYGDASCYGAKLIKTPNIDRLAAEGMRFTQANTPSSVCSPTRYALLTGRYHWRNPLHAPTGVHGAGAPLLLDPKEHPTLPSVLREQGYRTAAIGKWHLGYGDGDSFRDNFDWAKDELRPGPLESGFDEFFGMAANVENPPRLFIRDAKFADLEPEQKVRLIREPRKPIQVIPPAPGLEWENAEVAPRTAQEAVAFVERQEKNPKPFLLYYASNIPHNPITPSKEFQGTSQCGPYGDFIQQIDSHFGAIRDALERTGQLAKTLFIFTSDNGGVQVARRKQDAAGEALRAGHDPTGGLRGGKASIYEGGFRVPLIVRWPGKVEPGTVSDQLVGLNDIYATVMEALNIDPPPGAAPDSVSFLSALNPQLSETKPRQSLMLYSLDAVKAVRDARWKLVVKSDIPDPARREPITKVENQDQLYDLQADPTETNNLYDTHPEDVMRLRDVLTRVGL